MSARVLRERLAASFAARVMASGRRPAVLAPGPGEDDDDDDLGSPIGDPPDDDWDEDDSDGDDEGDDDEDDEDPIQLSRRAEARRAALRRVTVRGRLRRRIMDGSGTGRCVSARPRPRVEPPCTHRWSIPASARSSTPRR